MRFLKNLSSLQNVVLCSDTDRVAIDTLALILLDVVALCDHACINCSQPLLVVFGIGWNCLSVRIKNRLNQGRSLLRMFGSSEWVRVGQHCI